MKSSKRRTPISFKKSANSKSTKNKSENEENPVANSGKKMRLQHEPGILTVYIKRGKNLSKVGILSSNPNPCAVLKLNSTEVGKTKILKRTVTPEWLQKIDVTIPLEIELVGCKLEIEIWYTIFIYYTIYAYTH